MTAPLLDNQKRILPQSLEALAQARAAGIQVVVVTGRHHVAIHPFYQALQIDTPAICCNGTYLYDFQRKKVLAADPLAKDQAKQVLQMLKQTDIHGLMYVDDAMLYQEPSGHVTRSLAWAETLPVAQRPTLLQVGSLAQAADDAQAIWKFATSHADTLALREFADTVEKELGLACEWSWHDQGGYRQRRQQQRQAPAPMGGVAGAEHGSGGGIRRQLQRHQHAGSGRVGRGDGQRR